MKRRDFISFFGLSVAGFALVPDKLLWTPGPTRILTPLPQCGVLVDHARKTFVLSQPVTVRQFMATVIDAWDEPDLIGDESPVLSCSPEIAKMNDGWRVEESSMEHLSRGSVHQGRDIWSSIAWPHDDGGVGWTTPQKNLDFDALKARVAAVTMWPAQRGTSVLPSAHGYPRVSGPVT